MSPSVIATLSGTAVALVAITCATVGVATGHISGEAFVGIVSAFGGAGIGAGAHAAGAASAPTVTATASTPPTTRVEP